MWKALGNRTRPMVSAPSEAVIVTSSANLLLDHLFAYSASDLSFLLYWRLIFPVSVHVQAWSTYGPFL